MTLLPPGQADLFLPLVEAPGDTRKWDAFLEALVARTQARRGIIIITPQVAATGTPSTIIQRTSARAAEEPALDIETLLALTLPALRTLRPERVYALEELLDHDDPAHREGQSSVLAAHGIRFARLMRVAAGKAGDLSVLLLRTREDFSAGAAALLSAAPPLLRAALSADAALSQERLARGMAEDTLARLGIGQIAFDARAGVIAADDIAESALAILETPDSRTGRRLALPPAAAERLEQSCAAFAAAAAHSPPPEPVLIAIDERMTLLLRPAGAVASAHALFRPAAIATLRLPVREDERRGAAVLRELYRLSAREAALAEKLSRGELIVEAGRALRLTEETARNYSKRIYARTGSRGQADLVRAILCGLAPLA